MKIDVVIPNYNGFSLLSKNLPKIIESLDYPKAQFSIIIVDDFSDIIDYTNLSEFVREINTKSKIPVTLLRNKKNFGFSTTVNNGINASEAEFIVLLNSDVVPYLDFLRPVIEDFSSDEKLFGVGCMDESIEGREIVLRGKGTGKFEKGFLHHNKSDVNEGTKTLWISGGSCVIRRSLFKKISGFDEIYNPFYWEDIDLSYRAQKSGYKVMFDKRSRVTHVHEEGAIRKHFTQSHVKMITYRNQFIFVWKNITDIKLLLAHFFWLPYHMINAIRRKDKEFFKGFILAAVRITAIIAKRSSQKKLYTLSDEQILSNFLS